MYALNNGSGMKMSLSFLGTTFSIFLRHRCNCSKYFQIADTYIPRYAGSVTILGFLSVVIIFGVFAGGHAYQAFNVMAAVVGFSVEKVNISGNRKTSEIDLLSALDVDRSISLFSFNVEKARAAVSVLPWVESVSVQKIYPNQINISIVERQPIAIWQHNGNIDVIDKQGNVIMPYGTGADYRLPLVVGQGAARQAAAFLEELTPFSMIKQHARAYIRIGDRRWDILLDNDVRIKLPEEDVPRHLATVLMMDGTNTLFFRDIEIVDLRLTDRITVALSTEALARRAAAIKDLEDREKAKKAG
ncbi:MAG: cell division protein FtsQ [Candidatus Tokpelaia sp. JSC188]|nr:MAG: cell division protein FtsQ [Candidatus Tokpelaia sp. JSC188]